MIIRACDSHVNVNHMALYIDINENKTKTLVFSPSPVLSRRHTRASFFQPNISFITARKRSFVKVMFLHLSVILLTGRGACVVALGGCGCSGRGMHGCSQRGHVWLLWGGMRGCSGGMHGCSGGHAWLLQGGCVVAPGGMHGCSGGCAWLLWGVCMVAPGGGGHAWNMTRYGDTVNEWTVRILLECILVFMEFLP